MKVLQIISGLSAGGAEHFVLELCKQSRLVPGTHMDVLTMSAVDEISYKFKEAGIEIIAPSSHNRKPLKAFHALRVLFKQPHSIFHAHMFHACIIACIARIFRPSVKVVFTLHNNHVPQWHRQLLLFLTRPLRHTDIIFPGLKRKWFQKKDAIEIPTGIDFSRYHASQQKPEVFTFLFAGRLEPEKNPLYLISFSKSLQHKFRFHINVAGDGSLRNELEQRIKTEKLEQYITLHGHVNDITAFLSRGHCLLLPSLWEGMPMIVLEAAASSLPVITTPAGSIPQIISADEGYIGDTDQFPELADRVINNYGEALTKAESLQQKIKTVSSIGTVYAQHIHVYSH